MSNDERVASLRIAITDSGLVHIFAVDLDGYQRSCSDNDEVVGELYDMALDIISSWVHKEEFKE